LTLRSSKNPDLDAFASISTGNSADFALSGACTVGQGLFLKIFWSPD